MKTLTRFAAIVATVILVAACGNNVSQGTPFNMSCAQKLVDGQTTYAQASEWCRGQPMVSMDSHSNTTTLTWSYWDSGVSYGTALIPGINMLAAKQSSYMTLTATFKGGVLESHYVQGMGNQLGEATPAAGVPSK